MKRLNIWHVGNWCVHTGQKYIESPFLSATKGVEIKNYATQFVDAVRGIEEADVISQPSWELYNMSPENFDERLRWATTIVFGDVETKVLMLHPDFFDPNKWGSKYVTFPDRFTLLEKWVRQGGHFHMNGGWYSFSGELGKGGWGRVSFREVLPVVCRNGDDLIESTSSFPVRVSKPGHPVLKGITLEEIPPLLGFNQTTLRKGSTGILDIQYMKIWYPLLAVRGCGKGKVSAFTTGASPHWGINLVKWRKYDQLWQQLFTKL